ncbi:MAG: hypothetical protein BWY94_02207 [Actinobacteria bacterium ADurb.BinA094]|nr:MAG: hypothetical protein BWY94_02207 [Actinobacteria bacterium ADurb.BinA094]
MIGTTVDAETTGLADLDRELSALENRLLGEELMREAMMEAAGPLVALARAKAKRLTGAIADSIRAGHPRHDVSARRAKTLPKGTLVVVGASSPAARFLERGTFRQAPQPFLRPAVEQDRDALKARFAAALRRRLATL